jgi:Fe2+ or Zn2+ uptake regulation protein
MIIGCYVMHLYCAACGRHRNVGDGYTQTKAACERMAKELGWIFTAGDVYCSARCKANGPKEERETQDE